ncbi:MAG: response regulator transcription factor [Actinomycetia bacterium]|nr:response regulator transcription factor [Actinomycetes bacterium]
MSITSVLLLGGRRSALEPLALALGSGRRFDVVGIETDPAAFWAVALKCKAHIAVVEAASIDAASVSELVRLCPEMRIMVIGDPSDPHLIDLFIAGVDGYFPRAVAPEAIVEAVRILEESGVLIPPPLSKQVLGRLRALEARFGSGGVEHPRLGKREALVLRMLTTGATNREIASLLDVSVSTVKNQVASVFHKLGASNRSEAVALAFRLGMADEPEGH